MAPLYLGLDLSTQQLKAVVITDENVVVHESAVHFDNDLPQYGTTNGAIQGPAEGEVTSPVAMWLDAVDLLMQRMKEAGIQFAEIKAISGAGQQHGSVYWSQHAEEALASLDPALTLREQLAPKAYSIQRAPIWQDSSTSQDCRALEEAVGGPQELADLSGSRAYERFTGNQIAKIRRLKPDAYAATSRISLVSSFVPSLYLGHIAPIEVSDASGMNLMDVLSCKWDDRLLEACGGSELRQKLGPEPVPGGTSLGPIGGWWTAKWGFSPDCIIAPFTGDNPATVVSFSAPGDALLSLGTSTTFLLSIPPRIRRRGGSLHPICSLIQPLWTPKSPCYATKMAPSLANKCETKPANVTGNASTRRLKAPHQATTGTLDSISLLPEIIPPGIKPEERVAAAESMPAENHPRAILESQFLSIRSRITAILPPHAATLHRLVVTGGSSGNETIRQLAADLFGMKVYVSHTKEAAGMGGALLARYAAWRAERGGTGSYEEMMGGEVVGMQCVAEPRPEVTKVYDDLVSVYQLCEETALKAVS
ncbi:hypothetical protein FB45DRAFT_887503 [Roridomyces roridus]|uniref:Xylulose kinase n=1 Tax=Roridomyces roridus TaxID=1738132 RepID=A0AAD7FYR5_9AGAR|nr:hypothetical protein FB45DRAFT_887503 [Roridomyces roridus]